MNMDVKVLLESWGLAENIVQEFIDIDVFCLRHLSKDDVSRLIPVLGSRIKFSIKHAECVKGFDTDIVQDFNANSLVPHVLCDNDSDSDANHTAVEPPNCSTRIQDVDSRTDSVQSTQRVQETLCTSRSRKSKAYDINIALRYSSEGRILLGLLNRKKPLTPHNRGQLTSARLRFELRDDADKELSRERLEELAEEIETAFSYAKEKKESYFIQYRSNKGKLITKGKLPNKYYNDRRNFKNSGFLESRSSRKSSKSLDFFDSCLISDTLCSEAVDDPMPSQKPEMIWLKTNLRDWTKVVQYWEATYKERIEHIMENNIQAYEYAKLFPAIYSKDGYQLLTQDFDMMYPDATLGLYTNWAKFAAFVQMKVPSAFPEETQFSADHLKTQVLIHAPDIFVPICLDVSTKRNKKKIQWKPSKAETRDAFVLHVKNVRELNEVLDARRELLQKHGLCLQPLPVVVGPIENPTQFLVIFDRFWYDVESAMKAVDTSFKTMFAVHAKFPPDAKQIWSFIQHSLYNFTTPYDEVLPTVTARLSEFHAFEL